MDSQELLWVLTPVGAQKIEASFYKRHWNKNQLEHDFKLLSLRLMFEKHRLVESWTPDHEIRSRLAQKHKGKLIRDSLVPDALITIKKHNVSIAIAIELELTLKNKERLKEVCHRYQSKKGIHAVFYITGHAGINRTLHEIWRPQEAGGKAQLWSAHYDELTLNLFESQIKTPKGEVKLSELFRQQTAHSPAQRVSSFEDAPIEMRVELSRSNHTPFAQVT